MSNPYEEFIDKRVPSITEELFILSVVCVEASRPRSRDCDATSLDRWFSVQIQRAPFAESLRIFFLVRD